MYEPYSYYILYILLYNNYENVKWFLIFLPGHIVDRPPETRRLYVQVVRNKKKHNKKQTDT